MMQDYQHRVIQERADLHEKAMRLSSFITQTDSYLAFSKEDRDLLREQLTYMLQYESILDKRIERFKETV